MSEYVSINSYCKSNKIPKSNIKGIKEKALELELDVEPKISYTFKDLDKVAIPLNLSCKLPIKRVVTVEQAINSRGKSVNRKIISYEYSDKAAPQYLYMLKVYDTSTNEFTGIVKIGVSRDPDSRVKSLNKAWSSSSYDVHFKKYLVSKDAKETMIDTEQSIHAVLRNLDRYYTTEGEIDGYSELFYYDEWLDNFILEA